MKKEKKNSLLLYLYIDKNIYIYIREITTLGNRNSINEYAMLWNKQALLKLKSIEYIKN